MAFAAPAGSSVTISCARDRGSVVKRWIAQQAQGQEVDRERTILTGSVASRLPNATLTGAAVVGSAASRSGRPDAARAKPGAPRRHAAAPCARSARRSTVRIREAAGRAPSSTRCCGARAAAAGATIANQVIARMYMLCRRESPTRAAPARHRPLPDPPQISPVQGVICVHPYRYIQSFDLST